MHLRVRPHTLKPTSLSQADLSEYYGLPRTTMLATQRRGTQPTPRVQARDALLMEALEATDESVVEAELAEFLHNEQVQTVEGLAEEVAYLELTLQRAQRQQEARREKVRQWLRTRQLAHHLAANTDPQLTTEEGPHRWALYQAARAESALGPTLKRQLQQGERHLLRLQAELEWLRTQLVALRASERLAHRHSTPSTQPNPAATHTCAPHLNAPRRESPARTLGHASPFRPSFFLTHPTLKHPFQAIPNPPT